MKRPGFTLIETMLGFFLLLFVMIVVAGLLPSAMLATRRSECEMQADSLAQALLEETRAHGFYSLPSSPQTLSARTLAGVSYRRELRTFVPEHANANYLKGIRATVSWEYRNRKYEIVRETWLSRVKD